MLQAFIDVPRSFVTGATSRSPPKTAVVQVMFKWMKKTADEWFLMWSELSDGFAGG